jgi:CRP-like cAMP-binding protein/HEAT repeat protein
LLADPVIAVRRAAVMAAGDLAAPPPDIARALLTAANDSATAVRTVAIAALGRLGEAATAALVAALDDPVPAVRAAAAGALLGGGAVRADGLAKHLPSAHGWGRAAGLAILAHWTPWRWRAASLAEEGACLAGIANLVATRAALGESHGPAGSLLRRDVDDAVAGGLERWEECLVITDGDGAARIIRQGLASGETLVRAHAQEALEAVRSPAMARLVAGLHAPDARLIHGTMSLEMLNSGASDWRRALVAAAAGEKRNGHTVPCPTDGLMYRRDGTMLSLVERATLLRGVPPFADLSSEQLRMLAGVVEEIEIAAGETLVQAGGEGDHLYVVVAGQIALEERRGTSGSVARIGTLGPGQALGEDAVFDGGTHVLDATAQTDCQLLTLDRDVLMALLDEQPALARTLIAWLSARLRETTGKLAERTRARPRSVIDLLDKMDDSRR